MYAKDLGAEYAMVDMEAFLTEMGKDLLPREVLKVKYLLKDTFSEDALGQFNDKGGDLAIFLKQSSILEDELGRKVFKKILKEIERHDWVVKLKIYLEIESHFTKFNECTYICHMKNEDRKTLLTDISAMTRDDTKILEINRGAGTSGKEYLKLASWKEECTDYFGSYFKSTDIITVPSDMDAIMTTLHGLCSRNAGRGFVFKNYDMINHLEFLGYNKDRLVTNLKIRLTTNFTTYLAYIEQKNAIFICGKTMNGYNTNQCVENIVASVKCFVTLYGNVMQLNGVNIIGLLIRANQEREKGNELIQCKFCKLFSPSQIAFDSTGNFLAWFNCIEKFHKWWDLGGSKGTSIHTNNDSLFDSLAAEILGFMAAAQIPNLPSLTKDVTQKLKQTYLLYTPQQMNVYFSDAKHVIIQGSYGSGKSILGLKKLELIRKKITPNEIIIYVNFDSKSKLHIEMEKNVSEVLEVFSKDVQRISSIAEISKSRDSTVYIWHNSTGENLSTILREFTNMENLKMLKVNLIIEEYDGETLTQKETAHIKKLIKSDNFKESHVIILPQPLMKKRSWSAGNGSYKRESYMFQELKDVFKITKLEKTLRCTNEIYNITEATQKFVEKKDSVFPIETKKLRPSPRQISLDADYSSQTFTNPESISSSYEKVPSDQDNSDRIYEQTIDLDQAFGNRSVLQKHDGGKNMIVTKFSFVCEPRPGLDIPRKKPKLIEFSEKIHSTSDIAVITLSLALNEFILENRKTTLLYTTESKPEILRRAIHLFPQIISNVCPIKSLEEYKVTYTESFEEYLENKETRLVFLSNFRNVNGMEFENVLILLNHSEYYLKHYLPQMISRCNCNLNFILLPQEKQPIKKSKSWAKIRETFLSRSKSVEDKHTVGHMIEEWNEKNLVIPWRWDYETTDCQDPTCQQGDKCYCILSETEGELFAVHSKHYKDHIIAHDENAEGSELAEAKILDFITSCEEQKTNVTPSSEREENQWGGGRPRPKTPQDQPASEQIQQGASNQAAEQRPSTPKDNQAIFDSRILHKIASGQAKLKTQELHDVFDVNCLDGYGATPLLTAIRNSNADFVKVLLDHGADINIIDNFGWSAKELAKHHGIREIEQLIANHERNRNNP